MASHPSSRSGTPAPAVAASTPTRPAPKTTSSRSVTKKRDLAEDGATPAPKRQKKHGAAPKYDTRAVPFRYHHDLPSESFRYNVKAPTLVSREDEPLLIESADRTQGTEFKRPTDQAENRKTYRYSPCAADPRFAAMRFYRNCDMPPYVPRFNFSDSDKRFFFADNGTSLTNEKGWRSARANVVVREGRRYYFEVRIVKGLVDGSGAKDGPRIRAGWSRREAGLDTPVGFDAYSYGITDRHMEAVHRSRPFRFVESKSADSFKQGDVMGLEISLPSYHRHRLVSQGMSEAPADAEATAMNIVRDRFPVPFKGTMFFESMEYKPTKAMEVYGGRGPASSDYVPSPDNPEPSLRTLPDSQINVYKNGVKLGTAFEDLLAFLPPASGPGADEDSSGGGSANFASSVGLRVGVDDGTLGYYPTVSVFGGGIAETNFGPGFWCPPMNTDERIRPVGERYKDQLAEDVVYDTIDEIGYFMADLAEEKYMETYRNKKR